MSDSTTTITSSFSGPQLFGHPRGLATLFLTETFERFTYYGMRAILVLFMTAAATGGGLGLDDKAANNIYGLYIAGTYLLGLLGGYIADRLIGQQRAVLAGGILIAIGSALLAVGETREPAPRVHRGARQSRSTDARDSRLFAGGHAANRCLGNDRVPQPAHQLA